MLRGIRQASANWLGRIVMAVVLGLIAISFAIWGIGDIFRGFGRSTLATVGSTEIGVEQFRQVFNEQLQELSRQTKQQITPAIARAFGYDQQILNGLIQDAVLDQRVRQMRLNLSDAELERQIKSFPAFLNPQGQFDPLRYQIAIRNANYTPQRFEQERRLVILRNELQSSVSADVFVPKTIIEAFNRYQNELRAIDYVMLDRGKAGDIPAPTPETLTQFYEQRKTLFQAPEYRSIAYLMLSPATIAKPGEVSDADAEKFYNENRARFGTPERRHVQQIVFPNIEEARAAAERLEKGELAFAALATARNLTEKDIDLGTVPKSGLVDPAIAEAAFSLKEGAVSAPVQGRFGFVLVHVPKIEPENIKPFAEVAAQIKQQLAQDRAGAEVQSLHDKIEDERAGGAQLADIAAKLGLTARTIAAVDRSGKDPAGQPVPDLPVGVDVVASAFNSKPNVDNDPLQLAGGYVWYEVAGITAARDRALEEVKGELEARWREEQISERLKAKAAELVEKLKSGTSLADLATAESLKVETVFGLKRRQASTVLSPKVLDTVFRTNKGDPNLAEGRTPAEWVVFRVTDATVPALDPASPDAKRIDEALQRTYSAELLGQFVSRLRADYGTTINQDAFRRLAGGEQN